MYLYAMKKTKNISKYDFDWQICRIVAKDCLWYVWDKLPFVRMFWNREGKANIENQERIINWLEGLALGCKTKHASFIPTIEAEINFYKAQTNLSHEVVSSQEECLLKAKGELLAFRRSLWKDLYKRNKLWLSKGYNQKDLNDFMDFLYLTFEEDDNLAPYTYEKIKLLREAALTMKNTHKFLY